jgi:hypothetical protein
VAAPITWIGESLLPTRRGVRNQENLEPEPRPGHTPEHTPEAQYPSPSLILSRSRSQSIHAQAAAGAYARARAAAQAQPQAQAPAPALVCIVQDTDTNIPFVLPVGDRTGSMAQEGGAGLLCFVLGSGFMSRLSSSTAHTNRISS